MKGDTIVAVAGQSEDGHYSTSKNYDISAGTYDYFQLSGTSLPSARHVSTQLQVSGTKKGPDDSEITFIVEGMTEGTITLGILVDDRQVLYKTITAGAATQSPVGIVVSAVQTPAPASWTNFTSADGNAQVRASGVDFVGVVKVPASNVPAEWQVVYGPYSLIPQDTVFPSGANLSFGVPSGTSPYDLFLFGLVNGTWVPCTMEFVDGRISTTIDTAGTYALFTPAPPEGGTATPGPTNATPNAIPGTVPVTGTPTRAGSGMIAGIIAVAAVLITGIRKKSSR
jgi:hypothetical protein